MSIMTKIAFAADVAGILSFSMPIANELRKIITANRIARNNNADAHLSFGWTIDVFTQPKFRLLRWFFVLFLLANAAIVLSEDVLNIWSVLVVCLSISGVSIFIAVKYCVTLVLISAERSDALFAGILKAFGVDVTLSREDRGTSE
jgi:hypothetical protein